MINQLNTPIFVFRSYNKKTYIPFNIREIHKRKFKHTITLAELREHKQLEGMKLLQKGNRLSIMPVSKKEWGFILGLE